MRLLLATVALAVAAILGACSGQESSSEKPEQAATTEEKTTEAAPEETTIEQTTEVTVEAITKESVEIPVNGTTEENVGLEVASVEDSPPLPDWRTPSQKAGVNEAGQDVSNTPVISPDEHARRLPCLRGYYESLPPNQRGPESQRVTAEANAQGVAPYDIAGC